MIDAISTLLQTFGSFMWGWPLIIFTMSASIITTFALQGIQFKYFFQSWRFLLSPQQTSTDAAHITPLQAFINTLSASIGNGSAAGMATAMYAGGPGAAFWIFIMGFFNMAIRFAEVFLSTYFVDSKQIGVLRGGPMVFLRKVPGGSILPYLYAACCLFISFVAGSAMQCNSMRICLERSTGISSFIIALVLTSFVIYIMSGGAQRIIKISDTIIPIKVLLFFIATSIVLLFHIKQLPSALFIIIGHAFSIKAFAGGTLGYSLQNSLRFGLSRSLSATEAGLGTAGILFGATGNTHPMRMGIMSMASIFITNHLVCFVLMLIFVMTGAWQSGLNSTAMTSAAYETVFGVYGTILISFLSCTFGIGTLVSYAYIGRECWLFLTRNKALFIYSITYCAMALLGTLARVDLVWNAVDIGNASMMIINVYGILMLLPLLRTNVKKYNAQHREHLYATDNVSCRLSH